MRVSLNWVRELVALPPNVDAAAAAAALTQQGLEVEGIEEKGRELRGVLVAEVLAVRPHPNADKLRIVRLRAGGREEDVVCGAPNVPPPGNRVCWAPPGAMLPGGRALEAKEVRGVLSPGMICSEPEMGLGDRGDGILVLSTSAPHGADLAGYLGAVDDILEVNVTPNRPDALSHVGIARELAAHFGVPMTLPAIDQVPSSAGGRPMDVEIRDPEACPRYIARIVTGLAVRPSPVPMQLRLAYCGMRPINNLVDVTNYVLLETGHPLHAFDLEKVTGDVTVRRAGEGEQLVTLDGQTRSLAATDIVIADERSAIALAGVMGGASSEVSGTTRDVLLEAATFDPRSIRKSAKRLGLHSEASYRFERGVDGNGLRYASDRAAALLAALGGGTLSPAVVDRHPRPAEPRSVRLTTRKLRRVTGSDYDAEFARARLERLGFGCTSDADGLTVTVPSYRPDVSIEEDLIEEVLRMGEYGRPADRTRVLANAVSKPNPEAPADRTRGLLAAAGLSEVVTWGFVRRAVLEVIAAGKDRVLSDGIAVKNPISADYEVMRTSLLPGLADALRRNLARGVQDAALFEVGPVVRRGKPGDAPDESTHVAALMAGSRPGWLKREEPLDFYDLKAVAEELLRGFGVTDVSYVAPAGAPYFHPGVSAEIRLSDGHVVGALGELHPVVARRLELDTRALYLEAFLDGLVAARSKAEVVAPPRYPAVTRDVSFLIDQAVTAASQREAFLAANDPLLREVAVLEDFRDPRRVPAGKKGMLWSLTYRADDRTLTDAEVDAAHGRVLAALRERKDIQVR